MKVLVTNDDGIEAIGLRSLVDELAARGHMVYVAAPARNMSGTGKAVSFPARMKRTTYPGAAGAWSIDSTPATTVLVALLYLLGEEPDLVVSGVNKGPNMGLDDILTSGTVGAALEAAIHGIPSVAVSLATDSGTMESYRRAAGIGVTVGEVLAAHGAPLAANVNVPEEGVRGVKITRPARNSYRLRLHYDGDVIDHERLGYRARYWDSGPGTDVEAVLSGYTSITLLDPARIHASAKATEPLTRLLLDSLAGFIQA